MSGAPTTSHPSSARPVLIAGGGIGGMATALTLHQIGVPCMVFETVPELQPLGVGINLQPNAVRELTEELKGVVSSDMDAKAKQEKAKLLQAQIQMVQAQITAIQRAQQQEQQLAQVAKAEGAAANAAQQKKTQAAKTPSSGLGNNVDTYA